MEPITIGIAATGLWLYNRHKRKNRELETLKAIAAEEISREHLYMLAQEQLRRERIELEATLLPRPPLEDLRALARCEMEGITRENNPEEFEAALAERVEEEVPRRIQRFEEDAKSSLEYAWEQFHWEQNFYNLPLTNKRR